MVMVTILYTIRVNIRSMAWINFEYLEQKKMSVYDFIILQTIKQNKYEDREKDIEKMCQKVDIFFLEQEGLVDYIKGDKSDSQYKRMRLSKKGDSILDDISTAGVLEEDVTVYNWLAKVYKKEGKELGNMAKGKRMLAQFRAESGISKNHLAYLCKEFLNDEEAYKWSQKLEYLFFKAPSAYSTRFDLGESKLYQYYLRNREKFDNKFKSINNGN
jgi:hypothetical protein